MKKINKLLEELPEPKLYGEKDAEITLVCWGSHKGICLDAAEELNKRGIKTNVLHFIYLFPLDKEKITKLFGSLRRTVMVENNFTSQFQGVLKEYCGVECNHTLLKYDGRQFYAEQIVENVEKLKKEGWKEKEIRVVDDVPYDYLRAIKVLEE